MFKLSRFTGACCRIASKSVYLTSRSKIRVSTYDDSGFHCRLQARWSSSSSRSSVSTAFVGARGKETPSQCPKAGDTIELKDGDFLRITSVSLATNIIHGWRFCRISKISGLPQEVPNEVCWILHTKDADPQESLEKQFVEDVPISEFVQKRQLVLLYHNQSDDLGKTSRLEPEPVQNQSTLFCRWKYICCIKSNKRSRSSASVELHSPNNDWSSIVRLRKDECDEELHQIEDEGPPHGRDHDNQVKEIPRSKSEEVSSLIRNVSCLSLENANLGQKKQRSTSSVSEEKQEGDYTFGDAFCGAGGASRGAEMANLKVQWGFDSSLTAYEAYKRNFPQAGLHLTARDFIALGNQIFKVDILHLSPPCQAFSPANTTPNPDKNETNIATSMTIGDIISIARPRIVTLEQTPGITWLKKNQPHFAKVLWQFTRRGYSIRWKTMNFVEYGVPQERRRLIIIASSPGEVLPSIPLPTHGIKPGLSPFKTINDTINTIPEGSENHIFEKSPRSQSVRESYDGDKPLARTILTQEKTWHYNGKRPYTHRELACLQGFPLTHLFGKYEVRRHIGNAVPPLAMKVIFEHVVKQLRETDVRTLLHALWTKKYKHKHSGPKTACAIGRRRISTCRSSTCGRITLGWQCAGMRSIRTTI